MKKKVLGFLLVCTMLASLLTGCGAGDGGKTNTTLEAKTYPLRIQLDKDEDPTSEEITLYFVNGGDIPYVALSEYMPRVGNIYKDDKIGVPAAEYEITQPLANHTLVARKDNSSSMDIDTEADTIEFLGLDYFVSTPGDPLLLSTITLSESGRGGVANLLQDEGESYERGGNTLIKFDMSEYLIDLIEKDGECYMPLQTVNDLLVSLNYVFVVFNGIEVLMSSYSSPLIDEMFNVPTGQMSEEFASFNYNELRFMLDTTYGLKDEHDIDNFGDYFGSTGLLADLAGTDPAAFDNALRLLTMKYFDDGHSGVLKNSYLSGPAKTGDIDAALSTIESLGVSNSAMAWGTMRATGVRAEFYPDHPEMDSFEGAVEPYLYEEVGDTAILTFDRFSVKKDDYTKESDLKNPSDTIELIAYAHSQITRENSPIKNVVVDLSCNGGGVADVALYLMAWLKVDGIAILGLKNPVTGAQSVGTFEADINLDGTFDYEDNLPLELNRYIMISGVSFSCGNLVPAVLKGCPGITLLGQTSGGGTCSVRPCTSASGAAFTISSPTQISSVKNGSFYDVDQGAEPDFYISKDETFYDREKLVEFIHNLP